MLVQSIDVANGDTLRIYVSGTARLRAEPEGIGVSALAAMAARVA